MGYEYKNLNPRGLKTTDCTVRAFAMANEINWYESFDILSKYAREECILIDDVEFIDRFLKSMYNYECYKCKCENFK